MSKKVLGIVGSYRKGGIVDTLVDETLAAAAENGAETSKIYLLDVPIEFCTNCRDCTQEPGTKRGPCVHDDQMEAVLDQIDACDAVVLGAPVNFFNINALTRRFMERLVCYTYWPWGTMGPKMRVKTKTKKAVLITSSAMPGFLGRIFTGAMRALKIIAQTMGAKPVATLFVGLIADKPKREPPPKAIRKARAAGRKLSG